MIQNILEYIFSTEEFSGSELENIMSSFEKVEFSKGSLILGNGQIENKYWFLENGFMSSFVIDHAGVDHTTHFFSEGDIVIDWSSFFLRNPSRENIQTLSDCICWQISFDKFQVLFHSIEKFREQGRTRLTQSFFALKNHSVSLIADQAKERYLHLIETQPKILQNIPLRYIASYLGITDTSLSRIRKEILPS